MGGAYRSADGGASWRPINHEVPTYLSDIHPETHQCVHKMALQPARPAVLFQQHHRGVYRSDDRGDTWVDISDGLPSRFGFALAMHSHDPNTVYVVPHVSDNQWMVPKGAYGGLAQPQRRRELGVSERGPPENAWLTILRESLTVDSCDPAGVYAGTSTGQVSYSRDEGTQRFADQ